MHVFKRGGKYYLPSFSNKIDQISTLDGIAVSASDEPEERVGAGGLDDVAVPEVGNQDEVFVGLTGQDNPSDLALIFRGHVGHQGIRVIGCRLGQHHVHEIFPFGIV